MTQHITTINPATEKVLERYPVMSEFDVSEAIEDCQKAFLEWREKSLESRAEIITKIGDALTENKDKLARLMTHEMGKLLSQSEEEIDLCAQVCEWTAQNGPRELKNETREIDDQTKGLIHFAPIGLIYGIQPWNYPSYQVVRYSIANLMAGNGVLLKHASCVTGTGAFLEQICTKAGLPEHLFKTLRITHDQSDAVINHPHVRGVTLTGSANAGRYVGEKAGKALKKTVLELGSNDAYLVLADADLDAAVEICVNGRLYNNGETCIAAKRFVVVNDIYDAFTKKFVEAMEAVSMGDPTSDDVDLGPMARRDLREKIHNQVEESVRRGAKILCGGQIPDKTGFYYPATVLDNVLPGQPAHDDELFGPVASLIRAEDAEDAMRIANASRFGLGGGIITADTDTAVELASKHFDTGMVFINSFGLAVPNMPFGGVKDSGFGREHGGFGMKEFINSKAIFIGQ